MDEIKGIDYFNRNHPLTNWQVRASLRIRRQMYDWFAQSIGGLSGKKILDHGTTPDTERGDSNCFIRWLLADGAIVYGASPEDITNLKEVFPALNITVWPPRPADFKDLEGIISSAVIEHVGSRDRQVEYIKDLLALHRRILLTTPNRSHWLEFHTTEIQFE